MPHSPLVTVRDAATVPVGETDTTAALAVRLARSAAATDSHVLPNDRFDAWFAERRAAHHYRVTRIPFADLTGWRFDPDTGDLRHDTGRFFSIEGLRVRTPERSWEQPIINQPEIGILGIVATEFDGVLHFLMQAKMEPGNVNAVQLSTSVQATRSNYTGAHHGTHTPYLEYFVPPRRSRVLVDRLQSEHGQWLLRTHNRNMVVEVDGDVPVLPDFCWLTLGQLQRLLRVDNLVNVESRTVLACLPLHDLPQRDDLPVRSGADSLYRDALRRSLSPATSPLHPTEEVLSWFVDTKAALDPIHRSCGLAELVPWRRTADEIARPDRRHFSVVAVAVEASSREVTNWRQPIIRTAGQALVALAVKRIDGVLHLLVRARTEAGTTTFTELGPTVQCCPTDHPDRARKRWPAFLRDVLAAPPHRIRYDTLQSEKGGRFLFAQHRYRVVELDPDGPVEVPEQFRWITVHQAMRLLERTDHLTIQTRTLLAGLLTDW